MLGNARTAPQEVGVAPIGAGGGAALRFLASVLDARAVVEIGTGTGVSGLWLLRGMRSDGVLTTVDTEAEHQRLAKQTFTEAGIAAAAGPADPRRGARRAAAARPTATTTWCSATATSRSTPSTSPRRSGCCGPGGVVAFDNALWHDRVADPAQRDAETVAIRELGRSIADHDAARTGAAAGRRRAAARPEAACSADAPQDWVSTTGRRGSRRRPRRRPPPRTARSAPAPSR